MKALLGQKLIGRPEAVSGITVAKCFRGGGAEAPGVAFLSFPFHSFSQCCLGHVLHLDSFLQFCVRSTGPAHMLYFA